LFPILNIHIHFTRRLWIDSHRLILTVLIGSTSTCYWRRYRTLLLSPNGLVVAIRIIGDDDGQQGRIRSGMTEAKRTDIASPAGVSTMRLI